MNIERLPQTFEDLYNLQLNRDLRCPNIGFTVTPAAYQKIRDVLYQHELEAQLENPERAIHKVSKQNNPVNYIYGIEIIVVQTQKDPVISWSDKQEMRAYIDQEDSKLKIVNNY